jgi:hypothetical protein
VARVVKRREDPYVAAGRLFDKLFREAAVR